MPWGIFGKKEKDSSLPPPTAGPTVGAYGKVPKIGDFVRVGGKPLPSFEQWLEGAMAWGEKKHGAAWSNVYGAGAIQAFTFRPPASAKESSVLTGVLRPSHDSVGRRFPLVVFARVPEKQAALAPHLMPLFLGEFLEAATRVVLGGDEMTSASAFDEMVSAVAPPSTSDDGVEREYDDWSRNTPLRSAWGAIYGWPEADAPLAALRTIREALDPFSQQENPTTPLSVRLPLGGGGSAAAAFWIDVVRRIARWRATCPSFFWSFDGQAGSILIQLGITPPSSLAELFAPDPDSAHVCDLTASSTGEYRAKLLGALPRELAQRLERSDTLVADLLAALSR